MVTHQLQVENFTFILHNRLSVSFDGLKFNGKNAFVRNLLTFSSRVINVDTCKNKIFLLNKFNYGQSYGKKTVKKVCYLKIRCHWQK